MDEVFDSDARDMGSALCHFPQIGKWALSLGGVAQATPPTLH